MTNRCEQCVDSLKYRFDNEVLTLTKADNVTEYAFCHVCETDLVNGAPIGIMDERHGDSHVCAECIAQDVAELVADGFIQDHPDLSDGLASLPYDTNELFVWAIEAQTGVESTPNDGTTEFDVYCGIWNRAFGIVNNFLNPRRFNVYDGSVTGKSPFVAGLRFLAEVSDEQDEWLRTCDVGDHYIGAYGDERGIKLERAQDNADADFS